MFGAALSDDLRYSGEMRALLLGAVWLAACKASPGKLGAAFTHNNECIAGVHLCEVGMHRPRLLQR